MPKKCIKFVPEYLIPNLNSKRFGERLKWLDKDKQIFQIDWTHKSGPKWTEKGAEVFVEWDKHKGHFQPENKQYYTQSKQRFRALLYKLTKEGQLIGLPSENKFKKIFCIGQKKSKRKRKDINVEYESSCEEQASSEDFESEDYEDTGDSYNKMVLKDERVNILEDHSYSASDNIRNSITDLLTSDAENEQLILNNYQDTLFPMSSTELTVDNLQKRVLVERNQENTLLPVVMPNFFAESYSLFDFLKQGPEHSTLSMPAAGQNMSFPVNILAEIENSLQLNTDFLDWGQMRPDPIKEEKK